MKNLEEWLMSKSEGPKNNNKDQLSLKIDGSHLRALEQLEPGFGNNVSEIIRYIVIDWLMKNMGPAWMKEKGLIK
jgi:hypothetical protein